MRRTLRQVLIALVATLVAVEILLQIASLVARPLLARESSRAGPSDAITILCVGDSHTYGAPLPDHESYPSQLQVRLDGIYGKGRFRVVNLGFPGVNSAFVANRLESQLRQVQPQLVIASGGANNIWNSIESGAWERDGWGRLRSLLLNIKLYRLAAVTWSTQTEYHFTPGEEGTRWHHHMPDGAPIPHKNKLLARPGVTFDRTGGELPDAQLRRSVEIDMQRIAGFTREFGIPLIWYKYPWPRHFPAVLETIEATGARLEIPLIDAGLDYERARADGHSLPQLADTSAGLHPSGLLFGYIVDSMIPVVVETLEDWYGIGIEPVDRNGT